MEQMRELGEEEKRESWVARFPCALLYLPLGEKTIHGLKKIKVIEYTVLNAEYMVRAGLMVPEVL